MSQTGNWTLVNDPILATASVERSKPGGECRLVVPFLNDVLRIEAGSEDAMLYDTAIRATADSAYARRWESDGVVARIRNENAMPDELGMGKEVLIAALGRDGTCQTHGWLVAWVTRNGDHPVYGGYGVWRSRRSGSKRRFCAPDWAFASCWTDVPVGEIRLIPANGLPGLPHGPGAESWALVQRHGPNAATAWQCASGLRIWRRAHGSEEITRAKAA